MSSQARRCFPAVLACFLGLISIRADTVGEATLGFEYDGVKIGQPNRVETAVETARVEVDSKQTVNTVSRALFGYNFNWKYMQLLVDPDGELKTDGIAIARDLSIPLIRQSGTAAQYFEWKKALGPIDQREVHEIMKGTRALPRAGLVEWVQYFQAIDSAARFSFTFNLRVGSENEIVENAADAVEFFVGNGHSNPRGGENWAARRIELGLGDPVPVDIWELGNEMDHLGMSVEAYVDLCRKVMHAVRAVYPQAIFAAQAGMTPWNQTQWPTTDDWRAWHRRVLHEIGEEIGYLVLHSYYDGTPVSRIDAYSRLAIEDIDQIVGSGRVKLYHSEHAKWPGRLPSTDGKKGPLNLTSSHSLQGCLSTMDFYLRLLANPAHGAAGYHSYMGGPWAVIQQEGGVFYQTGMHDLFVFLNAIEDYPTVVGTRVEGRYTALDYELERPVEDQSPADFLALALRNEEGLVVLLLNKAAETTRQVGFSFDRPYALEAEEIFTAASLQSFNRRDEKELVTLRREFGSSTEFTSWEIGPRSLTLLFLRGL